MARPRALRRLSHLSRGILKLLPTRVALVDDTNIEWTGEWAQLDGLIRQSTTVAFVPSHLEKVSQTNSLG